MGIALQEVLPKIKFLKVDDHRDHNRQNRSANEFLKHNFSFLNGISWLVILMSSQLFLDFEIWFQLFDRLSPFEHLLVRICH